MAGWGDGLRWDAAALHASAEAQRGQADALASAIQRFSNTPTGTWEGVAATAAAARRSALAAQGAHLSSLLADASTAYADAASDLEPLRGDMDATANNALSQGFRISDGGHVEDLAGGWRMLDPRRPWTRIRIWGSVQAIVFRLTTLDARLAGRLAVMAVGGRISEGGTSMADGVLSGAQFLGDRVDDGLDWGRGRWEDLGDLADVARDTVGEHLSAFTAGVDRFLDASGERPRWVDDLLQRGEIPELAEVLAVGGYLTGLGAGAIANLVTGEDQKFFDDGRPFVGDPQHRSGLDNRRLHNPSDLMRDMSTVYSTRNEGRDRPSVQITRVDNPGQPPRYIVAIPGTTESIDTWGGWTGQQGGTDWAANLKGVGYGTTSSTEAIRAAIDKVTAEHPGGGRPQIILTGHSQGGIIAANIAADPDFSSRYDIGGIMTAGSPIQTVPIPRDIPVVNFSNQYDPVPKSDLGGFGGSYERPGVSDVSLDNGPGELGLHDWHGQDTYENKIRDIMRPGGSDWTKDEAPVHDFTTHIDRFYPTVGGTISTYQVEVGRE
ncbi:PGAP1-like alpha/beta domain-containing protein [Tessaracoccus antarcticus]|uniref:GPI inositol-deacylase PGAP1-like alpha/beta domain-containing protein n=1 Tax=Tessaracoccus antarcticus TaxID=2479848 RepID=A0A3M0G886_9ACTN|nr:hypothetical protein [Tessaracoccus antarcticus]RMB61240.1 hypothetical protein EAX62_00775 [Tessaracoccus antarcticus]